jgi:hypothetical protein
MPLSAIQAHGWWISSLITRAPLSKGERVLPGKTTNKNVSQKRFLSVAPNEANQFGPTFWPATSTFYPEEGGRSSFAWNVWPELCQQFSPRPSSLESSKSTGKWRVTEPGELENPNSVRICETFCDPNKPSSLSNKQKYKKISQYIWVVGNLRGKN